MVEFCDRGDESSIAGKLLLTSSGLWRRVQLRQDTDVSEAPAASVCKNALRNVGILQHYIPSQFRPTLKMALDGGECSASAPAGTRTPDHPARRPALYHSAILAPGMSNIPAN
jgi:hypothetical protein